MSEAEPEGAHLDDAEELAALRAEKKAKSDAEAADAKKKSDADAAELEQHRKDKAARDAAAAKGPKAPAPKPVSAPAATPSEPAGEPSGPGDGKPKPHGASRAWFG